MNRKLWVAFGDQPRAGGTRSHFHGPLQPMDTPQPNEALWCLYGILVALAAVWVLA